MNILNEEQCKFQKEFAKIFDHTMICNDNDDLFTHYSFIAEFSTAYEQVLDNQLEKYSCLPKQEIQAQRKKRGRKPLRPNDPIRKKTEIKDKY